jgi:DNA-binding PadR family transcriptional regulator
MNSDPDIQAHLPLTETTLFILLSLAPAPRHGYAIMKDVEALSYGRLQLSTGTLYGALRRLLENRWIDRATEVEPNPSGRIKKTYLLTDLGRNIMKAEINRLESLLRVATLQAAREGA